MKKETMGMIRDYLDLKADYAVLKERIAILERMCWEAEEHEAKMAKQFSGHRLDTAEVKAEKIINLFWLDHSTEACMTFEDLKEAEKKEEKHDTD